ncbi:DUF4124 domain-containing protein [Saccharophagus degradans]|uniref:DUF4124 domain-containing protein n=1 Tax=Saccharophagus degradans TaxID=86304 RepID=UPI001C092A56|nr:DUF4124 domain-containing protein [Saccharophagus degradans]
MKKLIFKCVVVVVLALGASNYMMYIMTGKLPFSTESLPSFSSPSLPTFAEGKTTAYKWTDANGVVHYSSEPPPNPADAAVKMEVDPNVNLIQGIKEEPTIAGEADTPQGPDFSGNIYSPEKVKKLVDDAKAVQQQMNERTKSLEGI